jgi:hypothetical protein
MRSTDVELALESITTVLEEHDGPQADSHESSEPEPANEAEIPAQAWLQRNRARIFAVASKVAAISSLILTAIMAWPTISSAGDTRLATLLAEWTSQKEYLEFCEAVR